MPANARWDLIRRLKVNRSMIKNKYENFVVHPPAVCVVLIPY